MTVKRRTGGMVAAAALAVALPALGAAADYGSMRNGSFDESEAHGPADQGVVDAEKAKWQLPDDLVWPAHWGPNASTGNSSLEYLPKGGLRETPAVRLNGGGHIASYFGRPEPGRPYVAAVRARGEGRLWFGAYHYSEDGFVGPRPAFVERELNTKTWGEYRGLFLNDDPKVVSINPALGCTGPIEVDEVRLFPADPVDVEITRELAQLYGAGALVEDLAIEAVKADSAFHDRLAEYSRAVAAFQEKAGGMDNRLAGSVRKKMESLDLYLNAQGATVVLASAYNEMIALTRALNRLAGREGDTPGTARPQEVRPTVLDHRPGVRGPRAETVTIADVRSNKVRYDEGENAATKATIVNTSSQTHSGTLVASMHLDLDTIRELARTPFAVAPGETKSWSFAYEVGPETYGRAVEVRFLAEDGRTLDSWQEYYAVAAEWFRVHQHTYAGQNKLYDVNPWVTFCNQRHYFASEPTDFGVGDVEAEQYLSGQAGYRVNRAARRAEIEHFRGAGVHSTFYQTFAFCGQMGYEEMRKHPEYALYDANGQFAVDPIYGGYPNPMELASPVEVGPKRVVAKPHLDRQYTPWQHCPANCALEEAVVYESERIKKYAAENGFTGVYIDGNMGVLKGYSYDGTPNVPSDKPEDYARLGARNHRLFSEILKKDDPNFGTWFNWGYRGVEWALSVGLTTHIGSGTGARGDAGDENIKAATDWPNVMLLYETGSFLKSSELQSPREFLDRLIEQRDFAAQKWGANTIVGYSFVEPYVAPEKPGPSKWAWPTLNYVGAQLIATQSHYAAGFLPSYHPTLQFMTRYSRFLWAPDVKVAPEEGEAVEVSPSEQLWWKKLVYRRETRDGHDLIVHLVRIPPTPRWDVNWVDEPSPLVGVKLTLALGSGVLASVDACRPYHFEEAQQVVQTQLQADTRDGAVTVEVPPFRYHSMVVFRVKGG